MNYLIIQSRLVVTYALYHPQVFSREAPPFKDAVSLVHSIFFNLSQIAVK